MKLQMIFCMEGQTKDMVGKRTNLEHIGNEIIKGWPGLEPSTTVGKGISPTACQEHPELFGESVQLHGATKGSQTSECWVRYRTLLINSSAIQHHELTDFREYVRSDELTGPGFRDRTSARMRAHGRLAEGANCLFKECPRKSWSVRFDL